jgi:drug/metabolite transporter (DMT)-like permease
MASGYERLASQPVRTAMKAPAQFMSPTQWALLVLLAILWGGSFLFVGIAVRELPALTIVLARVAVAAAILIPLVYALGHRLPAGIAAWQPFAVMAILNNVIPFTLIVTGQKQIASGLASVLNATTPVFTLVVAHVLTADEKLKANKLAGVLLGLAGVAVLVGPEAMFGRASSVVGMLCMLAAALSYGLSGLWGRRLRGHAPLVTAASQLVCSSLMLLPLALLIDQPWRLPVPSGETIAALLGLAALATSLAYVVFFRIMAVSGSNNVMLVTLLIPVFAIPMGAWRLGEVVLPRQFLGAAIIAVSLLVIDGRVLSLGRR